MTTASTPFDRTLTVGSLAGIAVAVFVAFYAPVCMYFAGRMQVNDYGIYTNFLWNSAHGHWFRYLMDHDYLDIHLSFTLLLLAPLFRIWDHPYVLAAVQSAMPAAGAWLLWRLARREGFGVAFSASLGALFTGYALAQRVVLCDFHGVCLYFVLLPWLYFTIRHRPGWTWLPLALILGLREDAGLTVIPMLALMALRHRWRAGWIYAGVAALYTALACTVLFEWINEFGLNEVPRRGHHLNPGSMLASFNADGLWRRAGAVFWLYLPALPWLARRSTWAAPLLFPLPALAVLLLSPQPSVHSLDVQYPAIVLVSMILGIVESERRLHASSGRTLRAAHLLAVTIFSALVFGVGYPQSSRIGWTPDPDGRALAHMAAGIPKSGVLLTTKDLAGFCANRADLLVVGRNTLTVDRVDHVFALVTRFLEHPVLKQCLEDDAFGVLDHDLSHVILSRGADPADKWIVKARARHPARALNLHQERGEDVRNVYTRGIGQTRYWRGSAQPGIVIQGRPVALPAGRHIALLRARASDTSGRLELRALPSGERLAEASIQPHDDARSFGIQRIPFQLDGDTKVESLIRGGTGPLWLDQIAFVPEEGTVTRPPAH